MRVRARIHLDIRIRTFAYAHAHELIAMGALVMVLSFGTGRAMRCDEMRP